MNANNPIVLIGGSGLGPWAWERITPLLREHGFQSVTPQLRTTGGDATPAEAVDLDAWVEDVCEVLAGLSEVTLVAHSFAGYIAAAVLERQPHSIGRLIFIDAILPKPNKSWFEVMGSGVATFMTGLAQDGAIPWFTREQLDQLYPGHGISDADFAWMRPRLTGQPIATYRQAAIKDPVRADAARVAYVQCLVTNPPVEDLSIEQLGWDRRTLATGHWPMVTHPAETARVIMELAGS
jgi:pimeloyl-ACP methyl ester carboxylesterase